MPPKHDRFAKARGKEWEAHVTEPMQVEHRDEHVVATSSLQQAVLPIKAFPARARGHHFAEGLTMSSLRLARMQHGQFNTVSPSQFIEDGKPVVSQLVSREKNAHLAHALEGWGAERQSRSVSNQDNRR